MDLKEELMKTVAHTLTLRCVENLCPEVPHARDALKADSVNITTHHISVVTL